MHDYYNLPFSTFACQGNTLMVHISFYIKPINQESLHMYEIKSIPVPYHMNEELIDETESKYTYTKIKPSTEILAMGSNSQINLDYNQLVHCIQYKILFFCEQMFLAKLGNEHTCESAIYTHQNSKLIQNTIQSILYYTVNMATIVYQFKEKLKTDGITDLTLYTEKIDFDPEEPNLIVEEDHNVLKKSHQL